MSKPIKMTRAMKAEILADVAKRLDSMVLFDGKQSIPIDYAYKGAEKATVVFTRVAWEKQMRLVDEFSSEIGWHGTVRRDEEDASKFYIEDIFVFPQEVTGATVTPAQGEYDQWNATRPPEQFKAMRYHGHSHVRMGTTPSCTDNTFQKDIIGRLNGDGYTEEVREQMMAQLGDSAFYIFMIWNKQREFNVRIYDLFNNVSYEGKEVEVVLEGLEDLDAFIADAKAQVRTKTYQSPYYGGYQGGSVYGGSGNGKNYTPGTGNKVVDLPTTNPKTNAPAIPSGSRASVLDEDHTSFPSGYFDGQTTIYD